jgi:squalene-hopene/tetraprenyl-beta-curcumene cyclase
MRSRKRRPGNNIMSPSRRSFLLASALAALAGCSGSRKGTGTTTEGRREELSLSEKVARSRKRGVDFLLSQQAKDGSWRSDTYGLLDAPSVTPLVLNAFLAAAPDNEDAFRKGAAHLTAFVQPDGNIAVPERGFEFALYTAALSVSALSHPRHPGYRKARDAWLGFLRQRQLTEDLGWKPEDKEYGGWGYSRDLPRKPRPGEFTPPLIESNLSATAFALDALVAAGVTAADKAFSRALVFVRRCQNWEETQSEPAFDDGGFFFIYDDPVRNKAGVAGTDRRGRQRHHSYGSVTADGLRCLAHCGLPESDPRRQAARDWLRKHFRADQPPGTYAQRREVDRHAVYYYYAMSASKEPAGSLTIQTDAGTRSVRELLAEELVKRQRGDGSWANPAHAVREDDPITATCFALIALGASPVR